MARNGLDISKEIVPAHGKSNNVASIKSDQSLHYLHEEGFGLISVLQPFNTF